LARSGRIPGLGPKDGQSSSRRVGGGETTKLRPHHLIDIISDYGHGVEFSPHPYGHALHAVAAQVLADQTIRIELVLAADDICAPCCHLQAGGSCDDVLAQLAEPVSKQAYNDDLDARVFAALGLRPHARLTVRAFLERLGEHVPGIEQVCTHPGEDQVERLRALRAGLERLGVAGKGE
jgi:hypothetical protein